MMPIRDSTVFGLLLLTGLTMITGKSLAAQTVRPHQTGNPLFLSSAKIQEYARPPKGAVVLFDGMDGKKDSKSVSHWVHRGSGAPCKWTVTDAGELEVAPETNDILTREKFGDYQLHLEFNVPDLPNQKSQGKGNSGVYNLGLFEIQVLDSFNNETYAHGMCGAIYEFKDPDINACRHAGEWQTYDITFRAPRVDASGRVTAHPRITVYLNGIRIHDDVEITCGPTRASLGGPVTSTGPLMLQAHGSRVRYRNIWIRPSGK